MTNKKPKGLGRGLSALLGPAIEPSAEASAMGGASAGLPAWLLWNQQSALSGSTTTKTGRCFSSAHR